MPGVERDADVRRTVRTELHRLGQRPDERHWRRWRWWRRCIRIGRGRAAAATASTHARPKHQRTEELEPEPDIMFAEHVRDRRQPAAHDLPALLFGRTAGRGAQHQLKAAAADRRAKRRVLGKLRQLRRERRLVAIERTLHRQVHDRRADLDLGEERARGLHPGRARRPERPVDAAVTDARREARLLGPPDVASDGPRRQRDEHARRTRRSALAVRHRERRGRHRGPLQELPPSDCVFHALLPRNLESEAELQLHAAQCLGAGGGAETGIARYQT